MKAIVIFLRALWKMLRKYPIILAPIGLGSLIWSINKQGFAEYNFILDDIVKIIVILGILLSYKELKVVNSLKSQNKQKIKTPSKISVFIAGALVSPKDREFALDNIEERFEKDVKKRGYRWAKYMLWWDNLVSLWAVIGDKTIKVLRWAGLGYLIEKFLFK